MTQEREVTIIYKWKPLASRPIGRPKIRWKDDLLNDLQTVRSRTGRRVYWIGTVGRQSLGGPKLTTS
jgi:hypothetical protein